MMITNKVGTGTIGAALEELIFRLEKISVTPAMDARRLLVHVTGLPAAWLMAHPEAGLEKDLASTLDVLVNRLENGEPFPYVLGRWEFFGLEFEVTPEVLIPRPETELLVERAFTWLKNHPERRKAADIGTGSGCIGIALAVNIPNLQVVAGDISPDAVKLATRNAMRYGVEKRMEFLCSDLFPPAVKFDLILANLPYIPTETLQDLPVYGREPTLALDGGVDGLALIRRLIAATPDKLLPGGLLLMEIEASEGTEALSLAYDSFAEAEIHLYKDLAGRDRILEVQV